MKNITIKLISAVLLLTAGWSCMKSKVPLKKVDCRINLSGGEEYDASRKSKSGGLGFYDSKGNLMYDTQDWYSEIKTVQYCSSISDSSNIPEKGMTLLKTNNEFQQYLDKFNVSMPEVNFDTSSVILVSSKGANVESTVSWLVVHNHHLQMFQLVSPATVDSTGTAIPNNKNKGVFISFIPISKKVVN